MRDNYRWLMKWLHPDRNQDGWEAVYADRVNVAWQDLKTPDRRARYDQRSPSTQMLTPMASATMRRPVHLAPIPDAGGPLLSGSTVRRLPTLVLGALGVAAMAMIGVTYWAQNTTQRELSELRRDRAPPVDMLSTRPALGSREAPTATAAAAAATSAATAAVRANLDAIAVLVADVVPMGQVPDTRVDEPAHADVPAISAASVVTVAETELVAAAEPAPVATATEPAVVSNELVAAAQPAAPEAAATDQTPITGELPDTTGQGAAIASAQAVAAASLAPVASAPATPLPKAVEPSTSSPEPAAVAAQVAPAPAVARKPLPAQRPLPAPALLSVAKPDVVAAAPAQNSANAPKPSTVIAARLPEPAASPAQPRPRAVPVSPPVVAAKVVDSPAQPSPDVPPAPSAPRAAPNSTAVATAEAPESSASSLLAVAPPPPRPAPAQRDAEALIREFASAYAAGDLARFDRLFTRASPEVAALIQMRSRFGSTEMRYLQIEQVGWHAEAEQGRVRAHYRDTYVPRGRRKAITESGVIEWTIRVDAGDARIASVARNNGGS